MIGEISKRLKDLVGRGDLFALAAALLLALAAFYFLQALVEGLIAPAVAAILGEPGLYALTFTVNGAEFGYGSVLTGLILLAVALAVVTLVGKVRQGR
ncbi:MAG TPA: MscL family protein [Solirubrobacterales bacterium]|nr:MscL family protein [Solirubrobacterales bacterium]